MMLANLGGLYSAGKSELQSLISSLFGQEQQGLLFVPQPVLEGEQTLYQLDDGTTLADAHGDPVGLGLEWSQGLELGPELFLGLMTDSWNTLSGATLLTDTSFSTSGTNTGAYKAVFEVGRFYELDLDIETTASTIQVVGALASSPVIASDATRIQGKFIWKATTDTLYLRQTSSATVTINTLSVRELPGNHLTQPTSADRPTYNTDGTLHWLAHDGAGDNLQSTYSSPVAQPCTLSVAIDKKDTGSDKVIVTGLGSADRHQLSINASGNLVGIAGGTTLDSGAGLSNGKHIVTAVLDGVSSSIRVDGVEVASGDLGSASSDGLTLSSLWDGTLSITQDVYGSVHAEGVDDVGRVESYLNDRIGGNVL